MKFTTSTGRHYVSLIRRRCTILIFAGVMGAALGTAAAPAGAHMLDEAFTPDVADAGVAPLAAAAPTGTSAGCGRTGHHSAGLVKWTVKDGAGRTRSFLMEVPGDYDPAKPYALTFVYHGAGGNSAQSYSWGLQAASGAAQSSIFVFPDGINFQNYGVGWDDAAKGYDIPFFDNMVKDVETYFCIDKARVFAAGFSWGGDFVTALACNRGNAIRAVAVNSSTDEYTQKTDYMTYQGMPCSATTVHPGIRFQHAAGGDSAYPAPYFANTTKLYQHLNSCGTTSTPAASTTTMACVSYNSCSAKFVDCTFIASIGHTLPPNWAKDTWGFFSSYH